MVRLIEYWKKYLRQNKFVGAVQMDLSKAFDCMSHDLLIAKIYGKSDVVLFLYKRRKEYVKINKHIVFFRYYYQEFHNTTTQ